MMPRFRGLHICWLLAGLLALAIAAVATADEPGAKDPAKPIDNVQFQAAEVRSVMTFLADYGQVNVILTQGETVTTFPQASSGGACPSDQPAWYYDVPSAPTKIDLCENACNTVSEAGDGASLNVVAGCTATIVVQ